MFIWVAEGGEKEGKKMQIPYFLIRMAGWATGKLYVKCGNGMVVES